MPGKRIEGAGGIEPYPLLDVFNSLRKTVGHKSTIAPRCSPGQPLCLQQNYFLAAARKFQCCGEPCKPAPDDANIGFHDAAQRFTRFATHTRGFVPGWEI